MKSKMTVSLIQYNFTLGKLSMIIKFWKIKTLGFRKIAQHADFMHHASLC